MINVKDAKDFSKDQDPVHGVLKGENRKLKAGGYQAELIMSLLIIWSTCLFLYCKLQNAIKDFGGRKWYIKCVSWDFISVV